MISTVESDRRVRTLNRITTELIRINGYRERLEKLAQLVVPLLGDWCIVDLAYDNEIERLTIVEPHQEKEKTRGIRRISKKLEMDRKGLIDHIWKEGKAWSTKDFDKEIISGQRTNWGPAVIALLEARGKRIGKMTLIKEKGKGAYSLEEVEFIRNLAAQAGILVENSVLLAKANQQLAEQKKARKALQDSEETLRLAINAGKMGLWDWEINSGRMRLSRDCELLYDFNGKKFTGSLEQVIGKIHETDRARVLDEIKMSVVKRGDYQSEYRVATKDGGLRWLLSTGKVISDRAGVPTRMLGVVSDITERKEIEVSLKQSERKFKLIFQNAMDMIMIADRHGRILDVNPAVIKMWGKPAEEIVKMRMSDLVEKDRDKIKDKWKNLPETETQIGEIETKTGKGADLIFEYAATTNILPQQDLFIFRDITDRVIEEHRREHFLGIASHELRSPLASIKAFNYLLKKIPGVSRSPKATEFLAKIDDKVDTVTRLINDLLDVTRIRGGKLDMVKEIFDLDRLVKDVAEELTMTLRSHKVIVAGRTGKQITADKRKITQVLVNLIRNAVKYSPDANKVEIILSKRKDEVLLAVKDYGMGISKDDKSRVFELYYRGADERKERIRGLGVGLFISEQIIKGHKGKIWVESQKNKGSTFYFSLPTENA